LAVLQPLERLYAELVGHARPAEVRAVIAEVLGVVDVVQAEELPPRPGPPHPRHDADGALVPGPTEVAGEGHPVAGRQAAVALLVLDPQAGQEGGVGQPAAEI